MFMARRRPLMGMAMLGGAGYMVGKRRAQSQEAQQQQEQSQDDQIQQLQQQQAPAAPAPAAAGGDDLVSKLKDLTDMKSSGALSDAEFDQAKAKLLGGTS
jgi:outer membrane protein OmpA-like peptidoglycan-associated protein